MSIFTACSFNKKEISRELVNARYTPAHSSTKTDYEYKYNWNKDEYEYVPGIRYVNEPEKYEFEYIVTYDDVKPNHKPKRLHKRNVMLCEIILAAAVVNRKRSHHQNNQRKK